MTLLRTAFYMAVGFAAGFFYKQYQNENRENQDRLNSPLPSKPTVPPQAKAIAEKASDVSEVSERVVQDDLTQVKGIGPVFAERFYEAGIKTFAALATLTPERAREISRLPEWHQADPAEWISQAAELS